MKFFASCSDEEKNEVKNLWRYCFTDSDEYVDYYFENIYKKENNFIIKNNERIVCSLMTNKYQISIKDKITDTSYIVGVSSSPTDRGHGFASELIKNTLNTLYQKKEQVAMLMPIDTSIYTRYAFTNIYDMLELDIPIDRIKILKNDLKVSFYEDDKIADLIYIYSQCVSKIDNFFVRDEKYFEKLVSEVRFENGHIMICYDDNNKPISYMLFYPKNDLGKSGFVREIFSINRQGYDALFLVIKYHFTQMSNITLHTYPYSDVFYYFEGDNKIKYTQKPFMMSRIINAKNILENIDTKENLNIKVTDNIIKENNNVITVGKGISFISQNDFDIELDIYDLSKLYFGYESIKNIVFRKNISIDCTLVEKINRIFYKKVSYFNDYV